MPTVVCVYAGKGGIGKTTVASVLAYLLGRDNGRTLLIDANREQPSASVLFQKLTYDAPYTLTVEDKPENLRRVKSLDFDYVVIDCPPSRTEAAGALDEADMTVVPFVSSFLETRAIMQTAREVFGLGESASDRTRYAILFVMLDRSQRSEADHARAALDGVGAPMFATEVRRYKAISKAQRAGVPIVEPEAAERWDKADEAARDALAVRDELLTMLPGRSTA